MLTPLVARFFFLYDCWSDLESTSLAACALFVVYGGAVIAAALLLFFYKGWLVGYAMVLCTYTRRDVVGFSVYIWAFGRFRSSAITHNGITDTTAA